MTRTTALFGSIYSLLLWMSTTFSVYAQNSGPQGGGNPTPNTLPITVFQFTGAGGNGSGVVGDETLPGMFDSIIEVLFVSVVPLALAMFLIGAFLYTISTEAEERKNQGKEYMKFALIGLAVVVGAKGILNMILFFVYGN